MSRPETGRTGARFGPSVARARHAPDPDTAHGHPVEDPVPEAVADEVGLTGARFGGRARKSRKDRQAEKVRAEVVADVPVAPDAPSDDERPTAELPRVVDDPVGVEVEVAAGIAGRPYVLTGGRTKVRAELRIETLISTVGPSGPQGEETGERHAVLELCVTPRSVSEVAALTRVPLGVARVLIDDLATEGRVRVHLGVDAATGPDVELMNRVLAGLRRL